MRLLLKGGIVIEDPRQPARQVDVAVSEDRIVGVGSAESLNQHGPYDKVIDCRGRVVLPGLVNAHTHTFQTLFRGLGEGLPFPRWQREVIYPLYECLTADVAALFSLVGCIENIRSGVTSVTRMTRRRVPRVWTP
jgi:5-methylthioadenosine/S-adenosylhomocysteine deaminase